MAEGYDGGSVFMSVIPSFRGVVREIVDQFTKYGAQAGEAFSKSFEESVRRGTGDLPVGPSDEESTRQGSSSGGKFAEAFRARVDAALKSLPDASVNLDDKEAEAKLTDLRTRLETLRGAEIGVDISDTRALTDLEALRVDLDELGKKSPSIRVKVDTAAAVAELEAVRVASDEVSGSSGGGLKGFLGLSSSAEGASSALGGVLEVAAFLAPALIPLGAAVIGVGIGFTGMAVAATAGVGAFAFAALPVFSQVSTAMQQISTDQQAVNRATSTAQRNTALLHLQDDLNALSPTVAALTFGVVQAKDAFTDWASKFDPLVVRVFTSALNDLRPALSAVSPLVTAGGNALTHFFGVIGDQVRSPGFQSFTHWLAGEVGPAVSALQVAFDNLGRGIASMMQNSGGLITIVEHGIDSLTGSFAQFTASSSFKSFVDYVIANGPLVGQLFDGIGKSIAGVVTALAPVGTIILTGLAGLSSAIGGIASVVGAFPTPAIYAIATAFGVWALTASPILALAGALTAVGIAIHGLQPLGKVKPLTDDQIWNATAAINNPKASWSQKIDLANAYQRGLTDQQLKDASKALVPNGPDPNFVGPLAPGQKAPPAPKTPAQLAPLNYAKQQNTTETNDAQIWRHDAAHWFDLVRHDFSTFGADIEKGFDGATKDLDRGRHNVAHWWDLITGDIANWVTKSVPHAFMNVGHTFRTGFDGATNALDLVRHDIAHQFDNITGGVSNWVTKSVPHAFSNIGGTFRSGFDGATSALDTARHDVASAFDNITTDIANWVTQSVPHAFDGIRHAFASAFDTAGSWLANVGTDLINGLIGGINAAINTIDSNIPSILGHKLFPSIPDIPKIGGRAAGGPIDAGVPYIVGELGPELIVPRGAGDVINNATLRSLPPLDLSKLHAGAAHRGDTNFNFRDTVIKETANVDMLTRTIDFKLRTIRL